MSCREFVRVGVHRLLRCCLHEGWCSFFQCRGKRIREAVGDSIYYVCESGHSFKTWPGKKERCVAVQVGRKEYALINPAPDSGGPTLQRWLG